MIIQNTLIEDCKLIKPDHFHDKRGVFKIMFQEKQFDFLPHPPKQSNVSESKSNVFRGIHVSPYYKLVTCLKEEISDYVIDLRKDSTTYLKVQKFVLSENNHHMIYVPPYCGHAIHSHYYENEQKAIVMYFQGDLWSKEKDKVHPWNDPLLIDYKGRQAPIKLRKDTVLSPKDLEAQLKNVNGFYF